MQERCAIARTWDTNLNACLYVHRCVSVRGRSENTLSWLRHAEDLIPLHLVESGMRPILIYHIITGRLYEFDRTIQSTNYLTKSLSSKHIHFERFSVVILISYIWRVRILSRISGENCCGNDWLRTAYASLQYLCEGIKHWRQLAEAVCLRVAKVRLQQSRISTKRRIKFLNLVPSLFLDQQNEQQPELPPEQVTAKTGNGISQRKGKREARSGRRRKERGAWKEDQDVRKDEDELTK